MRICNILFVNQTTAAKPRLRSPATPRSRRRRWSRMFDRGRRRGIADTASGGHIGTRSIPKVSEAPVALHSRGRGTGKGRERARRPPAAGRLWLWHGVGGGGGGGTLGSSTLRTHARCGSPGLRHQRAYAPYVVYTLLCTCRCCNIVVRAKRAAAVRIRNATWVPPLTTSGRTTAT